MGTPARDRYPHHQSRWRLAECFFHARRKDFDRVANWWTNDPFSRQDKAIGTMEQWWRQIFLTSALQIHRYFDLGSLRKHVERRHRIDGEFPVQFF